MKFFESTAGSMLCGFIFASGLILPICYTAIEVEDIRGKAAILSADLTASAGERAVQRQFTLARAWEAEQLQRLHIPTTPERG